MIPDHGLKLVNEEPAIIKCADHIGPAVSNVNDFDVIECQTCGFKHIVPVPTVEELKNVYKHDYYQNEKPLYLDRYREDLTWWNLVYDHRYQVLEQYLTGNSRRILDIGSGPGYFLLNGKNRGWAVKGIEPSIRAVEYSRKLNLEVEHGFFSEDTALELGTFGAINLSLVLEHIPDPKGFLSLVNQSLTSRGMICIVVPNDFNPIQLVLRDHLNFAPWWVAPPHHINYFDLESLTGLVEKCGFEVKHVESTFPIDIFLLMGDNYIGDDELGRICHSRRVSLEKVLINAGKSELLENLYSYFAENGLGREIVMFAKKIST